MAAVNGYCTLEEFRAYARETTTVTADDSEYEAVIESASRWIDDYCGRRFYQDASATARVFHATDYTTVCVDDVSTTTGLVVESDTGNDGTYSSTISSSDYQLEPLNGVVDGISGWPYTRIVLLEAPWFRTSGRRAGVQVTARWGWAAVPDAVNLACKVIALEHFRLRDAPFGVVGFEEFGMRLRDNMRVTGLLQRFRTSGSAVMVG